MRIVKEVKVFLSLQVNSERQRSLVLCWSLSGAAVLWWLCLCCAAAL